MVRRHAALIGAGLLLLSGCSQSSAGLPTSVDYERAQRVWSDPWLAPETASVPEAAWGSPEGYVRRQAGTRTTRYTAGTPETVLTREVLAAQERGWTLTGLSCSEQPSASLARGDGLDSGATALVTAARDGAIIEVVASGSVPHHLDGSWPDPPADLDVPSSCLFGGVDSELVDRSLGAPWDETPDAEGSETDWRRDAPTADEQALLDAVNADPWVRGLDVTLDARLAADDALRRAPTASTTLPGTTVSEVVAEMAGWDLTWVSCGRSRATEASARLLTDDGVAVARLTGLPGRTEVTLTLPIPETPAAEWVAEVPVLDGAACVSETPPRRGRIVVQGTPVALVGVSQPVAD